MTEEDNEDLMKKAPLNVGFQIVIMLMMMLNKHIIVTSLENIEVLHIEIAISMLN